MEIIDHLEQCPRPPHGCAVTIGNFDGVHLGHRAVITELERLADEVGAATAVVTFEPHTMEVLRPERAPQRLTRTDRKIELLRATGLGYLNVLTFDQERAQQAADEFVKEILVDCLHAKVVMVGEDFRFGNGAKGDVGLLRTMGADHGFEVAPLPLVSGPEGPYSSTAIRHAISAGRLEAAAQMLGRPHDLRGEVIHGDERGRLLGFPTANVAPGERMCLPPNGVYVGTLRLVDETETAPMRAVINLGVRPTFRQGELDDARPLIEAHVLDADGLDLYGATVDVAFIDGLRDERRFDSVDELAAQIAADAATARARLV